MRNSGYVKKFAISSTMEGLRECQNVAGEIQNTFNFDPAKEFAFQTVLMESVNNAIAHGNHFKEDLIIKISIFIDNECIKIEVEDQGEGFDLENIPCPVSKENLYLENGRGIFFIRQLSNCFTTKGKGNIVDIIINR